VYMNIYHERLAKVLVNYSLELKEGMSVGIVGITETEPVMMEVYKEALRVGTYPTLLPQFSHADEAFFSIASDKQLGKADLLYELIAKNFDALINIWADVNTKAMTNVNPEKLTKRQMTNMPIRKILQERERKGEYNWVLTGYPTDSRAQDAGMSLMEYEDFVYKAGLLDKKDPVTEWKSISKKQEKICKWLDKRESLRYVGLDTDLTFSTKGRRWINCDGKKNFPDGEVFTCPVEDSGEGTIRFTYPLIYMGNEIEDVSLKFKDGEVKGFSAKKGENLLRKLLESEEGARRVGEAAIGTNYGNDRFTKNMLYDEKIGGTIHIALGFSADPEMGKNMAPIHLDILKDMKDGGKIFADDELFYENGKFILEL
ncbi:MAG: aminopeptidase, partial [Candidatus Methanofastidiosa archaeon]|nr:aminopeptidase [Candidatus Methanofastidiosa archaeon]